MTKKRKINVGSNVLRILLSELLPYELPLSFTNRGFYYFLRKVNACFVGSDLRIEVTDPGAKIAARILWPKHSPSNEEQSEGIYYIKSHHYDRATVPFTFNIRHKSNESRHLSISHPNSQLSAAKFYNDYHSLMLLHTAKSSFSVRRPYRVAKYSVIRDSVFDASIVTSTASDIERYNAEYDTIRSFFVYYKYDNIHGFFESEDHRTLEKKFGHLIKLDVQKCFESVYTHSIQWAVYGKESVKNNTQTYEGSFAGVFDQLVRNMNDGETHGILIGPEISRIFAEIILQRVDSDVEVELESRGIVHGVDYQVLRYVDDYFVFIKDISKKDVIIWVFEMALRPYRLHLNHAKEEIHTTPFISAMSVAKTNVVSEFRKRIRLTYSEELSSLTFESSLENLIIAYKTVLRETNTGPLDMSNFALVQIESRLERVIDFAFSLMENNSSIQSERVVDLLAAVLEFAFYVYGGSPRVTPAIKLARIVALVRRAALSLELDMDLCYSLDDLIFRETVGQLERNPLSKDSTVESLYLLTILEDLGGEYEIKFNNFVSMIGLEMSDNGTIIIPDWFHPLIFAEVLRYLSRRGVGSDYDDLRGALSKWCLEKLVALTSGSRKYAEEPILAFTALSCPIVSKNIKRDILSIYHEGTSRSVKNFENFIDHWFVDWGPIDLHSELLKKRVQEVY